MRLGRGDGAQEYFCDFAPLTSSHFSLNILPTPLHPSATQRVMPLYGSTPSTFSAHSPALSRHLEGLTALLLSLKKRPIVRFERMSGMARALGEALVGSMNAPAHGGESLWDFRKTATAPLLLILDRRNDPVTPLLTQWTYQAMVHELLGITNGRVSLGDAPDVRDDMKVRYPLLGPPLTPKNPALSPVPNHARYCPFSQEIVLSPEQDPFFAQNLYDNFGDLGAHLSAYVQDYSTRSATSQAGKIETVADMKRCVSPFFDPLPPLSPCLAPLTSRIARTPRRFIEEYPEFRKLGSNVSKHVALVGELSRLVNARGLLQVSELEQSLASNESHGPDLRVRLPSFSGSHVQAENLTWALSAPARRPSARLSRRPRSRPRPSCGWRSCTRCGTRRRRGSRSAGSSSCSRRKELPRQRCVRPSLPPTARSL